MITLRVRYCYVQSLTSLVSPEITRRDHCYCLLAPHICTVLFFTHIPFVVNHTINATPPERLQHKQSKQNITSNCKIERRTLKNLVWITKSEIYAEKKWGNGNIISLCTMRLRITAFKWITTIKFILKDIANVQNV